MRLSGTTRLLVAALSITAVTFAQRGGQGGSRGGGGRSGIQGGGVHGGGNRGGSVHGGAGHAPRSYARPSGPNIGGSPYPIRTDIAPPTGLIPPAAAYSGISPGGLRVVGPRSRYPTIPIFAPPIYYPGAFGGYNDYGSSVKPYNDPNGDSADKSNMMAAQDAMAEQIRQLSSDIESMRANAAAQQQPAAPSAPAPAAGTSSNSAPESEQTPIQLILNNGDKLSIKSYAVMSGMLWDFSSGRLRKVPISSVDIPASTKATEAKGGEFPQLKN